MPRTPSQFYTESPYKTGKVITYEGQERDLISSRGGAHTEEISSVGAPFSLYLTRLIAEVELTAPTVVNAYTVLLSSDIAPVAGNMVCLKEGENFFQAIILVVTPTGGTNYTVTVDSPVDSIFTQGCAITSRSMNVNGAVTPVSFIVSPNGLDLGVRWDIHGFSIHIVDDAAMDDTKFGGISALTRGLIARSRNGVFKTLGNFKRNADFDLAGFISNYREKTGGGQYSFSATLDMRQRYGTSVSILVDEDPDFFEGIVQDDLTGLAELRVAIHGHVEKA